MAEQGLNQDAILTATTVTIEPAPGIKAPADLGAAATSAVATIFSACSLSTSANGAVDMSGAVTLATGGVYAIIAAGGGTGTGGGGAQIELMVGGVSQGITQNTGNTMNGTLLYEGSIGAGTVVKLRGYGVTSFSYSYAAKLLIIPVN